MQQTMLRIFDDGRREEWPVVSDDAGVQAFYEDRRREGVSHNLAEMFAHQQAPLPKSDTAFLAAINPGGQQFADNPELGERMAAPARAAGVNITGATYLSGLAEFPGDPRAWIRGKGDVEKLCTERNWQCRGAVNVNAETGVAPMAAVDVAPDLVEAKALDMIEANPDLARMPKDELLHEAKEIIKPHWGTSEAA
jgi:hypothetical protein